MRLLATVAAIGTLACAAHAQSTPNRTLGTPTVIASEPFWNIASVRELSDGRLLVVQRGPMNGFARAMMATVMANMKAPAGRGAQPDSNAASPEPPSARVAIFDAKLKSATLIGHAGSGPNDYQQPEALRGALGDSTLLLDLGRGDLLVIDPQGKLVGTRSIPGGSGALIAVGGVAVDRSGRLLYQAREQVSRQTAAGMEAGTPDSLPIMVFDFRTGATIPVAHVRVAGNVMLMNADPSTPMAMKMKMKGVPFPVIDDWVVMPDGTLAIIRGADLHIDWIAPDGKHRSTPPIAYARRAVTDSDKVQFHNQERATDSLMKMVPARMSIDHLEPDSFPRFKPPFATRGAMAASDGTIWLPSKIISPAAPDGWAVIGPDGKLREIVHLAAGQRLLGFGKGVVYVAVNESRVARIPLH